MTTLAAIRTHRWGEDEARLAAQLLPVFGDRLTVVFHNRAPEVTVPLPVVDLTDDWVAGQGLRITRDYGWRCGDYALYALRAARPGADRYWLIEPDVVFTGPLGAFFAAMDRSDADGLGVRITAFDRSHRFARTMPEGIALRRAIFCLTRFSARALDHLLPLRRAYSAGATVARNFVNDEIFAFSHLRARDDMALASMADLAPAWFADSVVETDPDMLIDSLAGRDAPGVFHPVRGRASFAEAVAARVVAQAHCLPAMRASLAFLSDRDIAGIGDAIARRACEALHGQRAAGRAERVRAARMARAGARAEAAE